MGSRAGPSRVQSQDLVPCLKYAAIPLLSDAPAARQQGGCGVIVVQYVSALDAMP